MESGRDGSVSRIGDDWMGWNGHDIVEMKSEVRIGQDREEEAVENVELARAIVEAETEDGDMYQVMKSDGMEKDDYSTNLSRERRLMDGQMNGERGENPSWVLIVSFDNDSRFVFSCVCNNCEWKGGDASELSSHLQTHIHSEYASRHEDCGQGRENGEEHCGIHPLFIACPVPYCNRAFSIHSISSMSSHLFMHSHHASLQMKGLVALHSKAEFNNIRSCGRREKLLSAHSGDVHVCMWDDCEVSFLDVHEFFSHVLSHIQFMNDACCLWDSCTRKFKHKSRLSPHVQHHIGLKVGACPFCGEVFSSLSKLYDHVSRRVVDGSELEEMLCKLCRKVLPNEKSLRLHIKRHIVNVRCAECGVLFSSKYDLHRHSDALHSNIRPQLECSFQNCNAIFTSNQKLMQHLKRHTEGSLSCPHCSLQFRWMKQLTKHMNLQHNKNGLAQYVCHLCNREYEEGSSLSRHLKIKHAISIPEGFPRFQYKKCEDGRYRLQTNRPSI